MNFYEMLNILENVSLNLLTNQQETLKAFEAMEGSHVSRLTGDYSINGAIEWLNSQPEEGKYVVYGDGGFNRYFVYANGHIRFSSGHAMYPSKQTIQKAKDLGFDIH